MSQRNILISAGLVFATSMIAWQLFENGSASNVDAETLARQEALQTATDRTEITPSVVVPVVPESPMQVSGDVETALREGDSLAVWVQVTQGLDPNSVDQEGETLLNKAVASGHAPVVKALLDAGADVNRRGKDGRTPIMVAASEGSMEMLALLMERGADPRANKPIDPSMNYTRLPAVNEDDSIEAIEMITASGDSSGPSPDSASGPLPGTPLGSLPVTPPADLDPISRQLVSRDLLGVSVGEESEAQSDAGDERAEGEGRQIADPDRADSEPPAMTPLEPSAEREPQHSDNGNEANGLLAALPPRDAAAGEVGQDREVPSEEPATVDQPESQVEKKPKVAPKADPLVASAQSLLAQLGYDPGPLDGLNGKRTRMAAGRFQTDQGQKADGKVTETLVADLRREVSAREQRATRPTGKQASDGVGFFTALAAGLQGLRGLHLNSTADPQRMLEYCASNRDTWVYDEGTGQVVHCGSYVNSSAY